MYVHVILDLQLDLRIQDTLNVMLALRQSCTVLFNDILLLRNKLFM